MFEAEAEGLGALSEARVLKVPDVLDCGLASEYSYLAMDWLELGSKCNGADDGDCSLREAIEAANADPALDVIGFDVPAGGGVATIVLSTL